MVNRIMYHTLLVAWYSSSVSSSTVSLSIKASSSPAGDSSGEFSLTPSLTWLPSTDATLGVGSGPVAPGWAAASVYWPGAPSLSRDLAIGVGLCVVLGFSVRLWFFFVWVL